MQRPKESLPLNYIIEDWLKRDRLEKATEPEALEITYRPKERPKSDRRRKRPLSKSPLHRGVDSFQM